MLSWAKFWGSLLVLPDIICIYYFFPSTNKFFRKNLYHVHSQSQLTINLDYGRIHKRMDRLLNFSLKNFFVVFHLNRDGKKWTRSAIISVQFSSVHESGSYFCWFLVHDREWSWLIFLSLVQFILSSFKFTKARLKEPIFPYKNYSYFNILTFWRISFLKFASQPFEYAKKFENVVSFVHFLTKK